MTDFYDGPSCTPCNSSPTTPTPLATFTGPRVGNLSGGPADGSQVTSPPVIPGHTNPMADLGTTAEPPFHPEELKLTLENSSVMANRGNDKSENVPLGPNPPGLLSPEDRKTSLPNIPGALVLQSPAGRLGRKTSLHESHKISGFIVEPVLDPSDPIAPVASVQAIPTNPVVTTVAATDNCSSSSSSSSTADASSSATASPSLSDATPMVTVVQAHPGSVTAKPSNNTTVSNTSADPATAPAVSVDAGVPVANPVATAPVNVMQKPPIAPAVSNATKNLPVTTLSENADVVANVLEQISTGTQAATANQQAKETLMEVSSPESTITTSDGAALKAAVEAVAFASSVNNLTSPSDVGRVNVGGQTDHVTFVDESLMGTASNSIASTAPQSVSIPLVSSVAIDNKIEQAMDLVKSHLMFAVREEVDVLKEKIVELLERIQLLETENAILKQAHQNQLGNQGTQSLVTGIQLNTSPVPATLDVSFIVI